MKSTTSRSSNAEWILRIAVSAVLIGGLMAFLLSAPGYRYEWHRVWRDTAWPSMFAKGLGLTAAISLGSLVLGIVIGTIAAFLRMARNVLLQQVAITYIEVIRGTPLYAQILIAYYCIAHSARGVLAQGGVQIELLSSATFVGILTLAVFSGAYIAEIIRAAVESIDKGQSEAALSQGMRRGQVMRHILVPQALRRMVPPLTNQAVNNIKDSSLLAIIGVHELMYIGQSAQASTYKTYEVLIPLAVLYLVVTWPLSRLAIWLEGRLVR